MIKVSKHHATHKPQRAKTNNTKEDLVLLKLGKVQKVASQGKREYKKLVKVSKYHPMHQLQIATNNTKDDSVLLTFGKLQKLLLTPKEKIN